MYAVYILILSTCSHWHVHVTQALSLSLSLLCIKPVSHKPSGAGYTWNEGCQDLYRLAWPERGLAISEEGGPATWEPRWHASLPLALFLSLFFKFSDCMLMRLAASILASPPNASAICAVATKPWCMHVILLIYWLIFVLVYKELYR